MIFLVFWTIVCYGITSILVWGSIFEKFRVSVGKLSKFLGELFECVLCTSTWVGVILSLITGGISTFIFPDLHWSINLFLDAMYTAGSVWAMNAIVEFYEENRNSKEIL